ncbi:MAG: DUF1598 domain-containing protein [Planctomycetaceae bacterium]|nr:DUF1598 domain-containing protein [Planctomycetaceae bacterium]
MRTVSCLFSRILISTIPSLLVWLSLGGLGYGQTVVTTSAVGGVSIDASGLVSNAQQDALGALAAMRSQTLEKIPADLKTMVGMRKVSLRQLETTLQDCVKNDKPIPDAVKYLAGLQGVRYVFVYPEKKDIVLVGPGEGWKVDAKGYVVGATTGRPVLLLDDLVTALRTAQAAANGGIACSIDPTTEGLARLNQELPALASAGDPAAMARGIENALGLQQISVRGVPDTSHFARVLVAADYRMKRIAMNFDPSPIRSLPSYLQMVKPAKKMVSPRFWLEPRYDALLRDADGLAFELRGASVKALTEEDFIAQSGSVQHTGKASPAAQRWTAMMTDRYAELALVDPIFGQLQNCMELAVVGALVVKEQLPAKAGGQMSALLKSSDVKTETFNAPKQVESKASALKRGRGWVLSASGGVAINSWQIADQVRVSDEIAPERAKAAAGQGDSWYWN